MLTPCLPHLPVPLTSLHAGLKLQLRQFRLAQLWGHRKTPQQNLQQEL
jgi:hypothetical protein